jgi:hypothetical protein
VSDSEEQGEHQKAARRIDRRSPTPAILAWHEREDAAARLKPREEAAARHNFAGGWMG